MNILIDIGHPAHVHIFRNLIFLLKEKNHNVLVTVKKNLISAISLLNLYQIDFHVLGEKNDSLGGKLISQVKFDLQLLKIAKKNKIDLMLGTSITIAHVTLLSGIKSIIFDDDDDDVQPLMVKFGHPFASRVLSPDVLFNKRKKRDTIYYPSYHELAYLHPSRFTPDPSVLKDLGLSENEIFFLLRFNAFKAHHDIGIQGLSIENKRYLVDKLSKYGKVFITTEKNIDSEFANYQLKVSPEKAHSLLYYATLFIGDSQTMTSEASVLGTPSLRSNSFVGRIAYLNEQERKYGLTFGFLPNEFSSLDKKLDELLCIPDLKIVWLQKRINLLKDKIDSTPFYLWLIENYPYSLTKNFTADFWNQFKKGI